MHKLLLTAVSTLALLAASQSTLAAENETLAEKITEPLAAMPDDAYVTLTGKVGEIRSDEFDLQYGSDNITVELDRFGWTGEETKYLVPGESVTVKGFIDDDLFEGREIEAYNIQLNNSYVYYYTVEEPPVFTLYIPEIAPNDSSNVSISGTVGNIAGEEFTVTNSGGSIRVDASELGYDPFDNQGLQKVENGDTVFVVGSVDDGFFESKEIIAKGLMELQGSAQTNSN